MSTLKYRTRIISIFICIFIGCNSNEEENLNIDILTNKENYTVDSTDVIKLFVTNKSDVTIYYLCTCQIYLEEMENSQLANTWMVHGFEECLAPVPIEINEADTFEINIFELNDYGPIDSALFNSTVDYRLRLDLYKDIKFAEMLDGYNTLSNRFTIIE